MTLTPSQVLQATTAAKLAAVLGRQYKRGLWQHPWSNARGVNPYRRVDECGFLLAVTLHKHQNLAHAHPVVADRAHFSVSLQTAPACA